MNITILGHVCIDKNEFENTSYSAAGSPAMFMHKIFKQLPDNNLTIIAPYGTDFLPHKSDALIYPNNPVSEYTLIYRNITKGGIRNQFAHNREYSNPVLIDNNIKDILNKSDLIFIAPLTPNYSYDYLSQLISYANKKTLKVLLPQGYFRDFDSKDNVKIRPFTEASKILPLVDIVIVSELDHSNMLNVAKRWVKDFKLDVIITRGEKGAVAITPKNKINIPSRIVPDNEVIDSVGSGDIFSAGFAYWYKHVNDIKKAGLFANELARQCLFFKPDEIKINFKELLIYK